MKIIFPVLASLGLALAIVACHSKKKNSVTVAPGTNPPAASTTTVTGSPVMLMKSPDGIYAPGPEELAAIQMTYKDVTMEKLKKGHTIYTVGDCVKCHRAKSIYRYDEQSWKRIIDDMAARAQMTAEDKDAVYKYVLSIKAMQPK